MKPVLLAALASLAAAAADVSDFDWSVIEPSTSLNYSNCYDGHKCAKLLVPLDWLNPETNHAKVTLAVIARPAVVAESDASFGGSIMVNPGGPSASGVEFLLSWGERLQHQADSDEKKFEIVSFDPRGVGLTEPNADCYQNEFARGAFMLEDRAMGTPDASIDVVRRKMSRAGAVGRLCEAGDEKNNIRGFVSTSSVARDMVALVDKLDELRKDDDSEQDERLELRSPQSKDDTPRIQYWGFSYGTVLGNYFASMFPGRVGRMILEGVEDPHDYVNTTWALNLVDTQKALDHFWDTCFEGGSSCALFKSTDTSPADVRGRVEEFLDNLDSSPAPYLSAKNVVSITKQDVLDTIFIALYNPMSQFPVLATTINEAMHGNFTALYKGMMLPTIDNSCELRGPESYTWHRDAQAAIACGDGESQTNMTADEFVKYVHDLKTDSPDFGSQWSRIRLTCIGWPIRPAYRFTGPWTTPASDPSLVKGKPAAPILFVSSLLDPVTPVANAREASKAHPGSVVLVQDNVGHGANISPSKCREDIVKKYLATGELPGEETHCKSDCWPFQDCASVGVMSMAKEESMRRRAPLSIFG